ncbi:hypothetical protein EPR50_G00136550 [Perca flavescens]|uniref:FISNA domain-containing protein n=1 Tax=Perca flavescens TaxID=8167 RepID=A0A484CTJ9_PERFV|nr:hypothetical protein EPR50_G00136550 [Perca flavescens]
MMDDVEMEGMATPSGNSSIGDAVSGRGPQSGQSDTNEDEDDLYYIPDRRPSLDLGPTPMDTSHWHFVDHAFPPALSYKSMTSEENVSNMDDEEGSSTRVQLNKADSYSSCYSLDSDDCEKIIPKVKSKDDAASELPETPELIQDPKEIRHPSLTVAFTFKAISKTLGKLSEGDFRRFKMMLWKHYPHSFNTPPQGMDMVDLVDRLLERHNLESSLQITKTILEEIGQKDKIDYLETLCLRNEVRHDLCETLKTIYSEVCEDSGEQGEKRPVDDVFTNLSITTTCDNGPNIEHEVMTIPKLDSNQETGKLLSTKDILSAERLEKSHLKFVLITGMAGSGKTMAVRRIVLDWIEERSHQHVSFLFPLTFRFLKQYEGSKVSLLEIHIFKEQGPRAALPSGITYMYTKLLFALARQRREFRAPQQSPDKERDFLMKLGKLAFNMLEKGKFRITKHDWKEIDIDIEEAVNDSGLCLQYLTKPFVLYTENSISFIHPTMQEYLAAFYVFFTYRNQGKNIFEQHLKDKVKGMFKGHKTMELYKSAVDRSLLCDDGKLDMFLRFLFGMGLKTNLELLQPLCTFSVKCSTFIQDAAALIRKKMGENQYPDRNSNLKRCLEELGV